MSIEKKLTQLLQKQQNWNEKSGKLHTGIFKAWWHAMKVFKASYKYIASEITCITTHKMQHIIYRISIIGVVQCCLWTVVSICKHANHSCNMCDSCYFCNKWNMCDICNIKLPRLVLIVMFLVYLMSIIIASSQIWCPPNNSLQKFSQYSLHSFYQDIMVMPNHASVIPSF